MTLPVELQSISEVNEMAEFFASGQVLPHKYFLEATMPAMSPETIAVLESWIDLVNDETNYLVEYDDDANTVVGVSMSDAEVMLLVGHLGLLPKS